MKLFKKANSPYWWMDYTVEGQRVRASTRRLLTDKVGAQRILADTYEKALNREQLGDKDEISLNDAFEVTLSEVTGQTLRVYRTVHAAAVAHFSPHKLLSTFRSVDVENFAIARRKQGKKPNTLRNDLKVLKRVMNRVQNTHMVNRDIEWPKVKRFVKSRYLTQAEEDAVLKRLHDHASDNITARKAYDLCVFLLDTGVRLMEAVEMQWHSIDMINGRIEVYRSKTKSLSTVPLSDRTKAMLTLRSNYAQPFEKMDFAIRHLRRVIDEVCNLNPKINETRGRATVHSLRDTYATRMRKKGMDIGQIATLLGHTTTAMAEKYSHIETDDVIEQARKIVNG